jgi:predicted ATPase
MSDPQISEEPTTDTTDVYVEDIAAETLNEDFFNELKRIDDRIETEKIERATLVKPIQTIAVRRFKQFDQLTVNLDQDFSLMAGGNNSGKSTLLHALAIWEFCRLATVMERGPDGIGPDRVGVQGFGIGENEFSPLNLPSLKHLWTNLMPMLKNKERHEKGYTLRIGSKWLTGLELKSLTFALSLANDRLFIKVDDSNITPADAIPRIAYLPPFAGISAHEERLSGALRRRRIGEGLAGAVLRNLLLDMHTKNQDTRARLLAARIASNPNLKKPRIAQKDLDLLRAEDPWEILQQNLREVFGTELQVSDFKEEYHSHIQVEVTKGEHSGFQLRQFDGYNNRDLMVEGSGFLQWLSVFVLAFDPSIDVLLLDEPDAHLHPQLQLEMAKRLKSLCETTSKQVIIATHSSEILKKADPASIMQFRRGRSPRYLTNEAQKKGLLEGIGSSYSPRIEAIRNHNRVFFFEGSSDLAILQFLAPKIGIDIPGSWVPWETQDSHKDRRLLWSALKEEFPDLQAISLRDRDEGEVGTVGKNLEDGDLPSSKGFRTLKWRRRHIESYLIIPQAIAAATGLPTEEVDQILKEDHAYYFTEHFQKSFAPSQYLELRGKELLQMLGTNGVKVAKHISSTQICDDLKTVISFLTAE